MPKSNIIFPVRGDEILLGFKKRGFGAGKWNGFGGKPHDGETMMQAAIRELEEESRLVALPENFQQVAYMVFYEVDTLKFESDVFFLTNWRGQERETDEMRPQWFGRDVLPYDVMWADDRHWIPLVLAAKRIKGIVHFKPGMQEVDDFTWQETAF